MTDNRKIKMDAKALAAQEGISYTAALRRLQDDKLATREPALQRCSQVCRTLTKSPSGLCWLHEALATTDGDLEAIQMPIQPADIEADVKDLDLGYRWGMFSDAGNDAVDLVLARISEVIGVTRNPTKVSRSILDQFDALEVAGHDEFLDTSSRQPIGESLIELFRDSSTSEMDTDLLDASLKDHKYEELVDDLDEYRMPRGDDLIEGLRGPKGPPHPEPALEDIRAWAESQGLVTHVRQEDLLE